MECSTANFNGSPNLITKSASITLPAPTTITNSEAKLRFAIDGSWHRAQEISWNLSSAHSDFNDRELLKSHGLYDFFDSPEQIKEGLKTINYIIGEIYRKSDNLMKADATLYFMRAAELGCERSKETEEVRYAKEEGIEDSKSFSEVKNNSYCRDEDARYKLAKISEKLGDDLIAISFYRTAAAHGRYPDALQRIENLEAMIHQRLGASSDLC